MDASEPVAERPHSGCGIASFVLALLGGVGLVVAVGYAGYLEATVEGGIDADEGLQLRLGVLVIASGFLLLMSLPLGLAGLFQKDRRRLFAGLGVGIALALLLMFVALMLIGMAADG